MSLNTPKHASPFQTQTLFTSCLEGVIFLKILDSENFTRWLVGHEGHEKDMKNSKFAQGREGNKGHKGHEGCKGCKTVQRAQRT